MWRRSSSTYVELKFKSLEFGLAFSTGRDSPTFWDKGTEVPSLSRDKGTTGQAQNLAKGRDSLSRSEMGRGMGR